VLHLLAVGQAEVPNPLTVIDIDSTRLAEERPQSKIIEFIRIGFVPECERSARMCRLCWHVTASMTILKKKSDAKRNDLAPIAPNDLKSSEVWCPKQENDR
jgi:hypothetical protein